MTFDLHHNFDSTDDMFVFQNREPAILAPTPIITATPVPSLWVPPEPIDIAATLRAHQTELIDQLRASLRQGHRRIMAMAPCGFGKSRCAATIIQECLKRGKRIAFVVPFLSLVEQFKDDLLDLGITELGVIQADHPLTDYKQPVQICSADTIARRGPPAVDLVIIDEAHIWRDFFADWMGRDEWLDVPFIGLSATPGTKGLGRYYTDLISVVDTQQLIDLGFLSPFRVFAPGAPDLSKVKTVAGDYHEGQLADAMSPLTADIVSTWLRLGNNEPTLVFAVNRLHAQELQAAFEAAGISTGYRDAYTGPEERKEQARQFKSGEIKVMTNVGTLTTGVDWDVRCLVLARPTKSRSLYVQIIGRALRTADGKQYATILDHTSTTQRLGFVTDIHFSLDGGEQVKAKPVVAKAAEPKECPQCKVLRPAKQPECPHCGFVAKAKSKLVCDDGELIEVTPKAKIGPTREEMQRWWAMLHHIQIDKGRKPGWRWHTFKAKFGVEPGSLCLDDLAMLAPSTDVENYIKHLAIKGSFRRKLKVA